MALTKKNEDFIKNIVCVRRKPGLTRKEFFDHHFLVHGSLSDAPDDADQKPHKYMQTHLFDSAFNSRLEGPNCNFNWCGLDDFTELYFRDVAHLRSVFSSEHARQELVPDLLNFTDMETSIGLMAYEKSIELKTIAQGKFPLEGASIVAMLFLSLAEGYQDADRLEEKLSPALAHALQSHAANEVWGLLANVRVAAGPEPPALHLAATTLPKIGIAYKIMIKNRASVSAIRKAQTAFCEASADYLNIPHSFIVFGVEGLVLDTENNIRVWAHQGPTGATS